MRSSALTISVLLLASAVVGTPIAKAVESLPANQWTVVEEGGGGVRRGAAVAWLAGEKKFLVVGGAFGNEKKSIQRPFEIQTFDPGRGRWAEIELAGLDPAAFEKSRSPFWSDEQGAIRLNPEYPVAGNSVFDATAPQLLTIAGNDGDAPDRFQIAAYDITRRRWSILSDEKPPTEADGVMPGEWGPKMAFMEGAAPAFDPVNQQLLLIGGRTANAPQGFVGHWAFSLAEKKWRRLAATSETLDPLRTNCGAVLGPARDGLAAARNAWYTPRDVRRDTEAVKAGPATLLSQAALLAERAAAELHSAKASDWEAEAIARATDRMDRAAEGFRAASDTCAAGRFSATLIRQLSESVWLTDEAVDLLRAMPGPRMRAAVGYDPAARGIVVFGGDHGDYLLSDTWIYDCEKQSWRQVFAPLVPQARRGNLFWLPKAKQLALAGGETYVPKFIYFRRPWNQLNDVWTFDARQQRWSLVTTGDAEDGDGQPTRPTLTCQLAAGDDDIVLGLSSAGRYPVNWDGTAWLMRIDGEADATALAEIGVPAGQRTYFTVVEPYDPGWYDAAERTDGRVAAKWLADLEPNTWTAVPQAPRPAPRRDWGTAAFDTDRDQFYHWTGGHMADPASIVSTYHPATNRWSIPFVAEYFGKGIGFNGRPDCMNHTYLNYAYDRVSKRLVCTSMGGTCLYDPDRREFEPRIDQPFRQHPYFTKTVGTPQGVVCWNRDFWGILDVDKRTWKELPVEGKIPPSVHGDENAITYDSQRDVLWLMAADGYQKMNGQVWRYEMKSGRVDVMNPAGQQTIGRKVRPRESVYLPDVDLVLHNSFADDRQIAYDPLQNGWVTLNVEKNDEMLGGVSIGLMFDPQRKLVWAMGTRQEMFVLRIDPDTLVRTALP